jgi:hypothetical protein
MLDVDGFRPKIPVAGPIDTPIGWSCPSISPKLIELATEHALLPGRDPLQVAVKRVSRMASTLLCRDRTGSVFEIEMIDEDKSRFAACSVGTRGTFSRSGLLASSEASPPMTTSVE